MKRAVLCVCSLFTFVLFSIYIAENSANNNRTHRNKIHILHAHHSPNIVCLVGLVLTVCRLNLSFVLFSYLLYPIIKKCAAEATHRKTHNSDCCDTIALTPNKCKTRRVHFYQSKKAPARYKTICNCVASALYHIKR